MDRSRWSQAALEVIATDGVDQLSVEGLARQLRVTKGSFYWHFADRAALISSALGLWETTTSAFFAQLRDIPQPEERLRTFFAVALSDSDGYDLGLETTLSAHIKDPTIGPAVRRVTTARIELLEATFRELGYTPTRASSRARIAYTAYLGHIQLRRSQSDDRFLRRPHPTYLGQLIEVLTIR